MLPAVAACGSRRVEVPRLAGQILDKRTGKPIEGVAVYQFYGTFNYRASVHEGTGSRDFRWTTTDADGRFEFPAHVVAEALKNHVKINSKPSIRLVHRDYGGPLVRVPEDRSQWNDVVWEVEPDQRGIEDMKKGRPLCTDPCNDLDSDAFKHCYEVACGKPFPKGGLGSPEDYR